MTENVLLIDDEPNLLQALERHLRRRFSVVTATGGEDALRMIEKMDPFGVVVCDMRMPGMDGVETLKRIKAKAPDTVRMMLTGNADQQTAIDAINEGNIFRFYTKPCAPEVLIDGIEAGLRQYHLVVAERELLEKTLAGSVKILVDVLSMADPLAFGRTERLRNWARTLAEHLDLPHPWQLEVAAMLSSIGRVSVPPELLSKAASGASLTTKEREIFDHVPDVARNLVANIPRLKSVAEILYLQDRGFDGSGIPEDGPTGEDIPFEARVLKVLADLAKAADGSLSPKATFSQLEKQKKHYDPKILQAAKECLFSAAGGVEKEEVIVEVPVSLLQPGYLIKSDIRFEDGRLALAAPAELSVVQVERLRNLGKVNRFQEPITAARRG